MEYKKTLNLPQTGFPMKADLVNREPQRLERWHADGLYETIQSRRANADASFILHDGPPFANGDVHIGTALNKILKDIIIKHKTLRGFRTPYVPGWDCHGLPIEFKVVQEMRKKGQTDADAATIRTACDTYARGFIDKQRGQFKRLGVLGEWDKPYLTLDKSYEANELRLFAEIVDKGFVYRGKKPVYWSIPARTALAEAEVEYQDHVSQSVFVKFPVVNQPGVNILIWTTTPWTLPANLAVAFNSSFDYSMVLVDGETYIVSAMLLDKVAEQCGWGGFEIIRTVQAAEFAEWEYQHPFCNRTGKLFAGDNFVENTTGTGFVHIAPGHGTDDYNLGSSNGLPIYSPVDNDGRLAHTNDLPVEQQMPEELVGKSILEKKGKSEANEAVLELLRTKNALVHQEDYSHSYPHCWRSKTPVIFRAMDQWFIRIDHDGFRDKAIAAIKQVKWVPEWGVKRIESAVAGRPDWCISRQRTWGVPIPAFYDADGEPILDGQIVRNTAALVEQHGSNVWFEKSAEELWAQVKPEGWSGKEAVDKAKDTLDVWIDSGSSSASVLKQREELLRGDGSKVDDWQADIYLEGSDQHRGWFQSSLLLSLAGNGAPPYKTVLTHGFMVDEDRQKISKSKQAQGGAYEKPQTADAYVKERGADVVRLWVASQDYRNDIMVSQTRINKVAETYRLLRNTLRFQLSNLFDFDPVENSVGALQMTGIDRWALSVFAKLQKDIETAYDAYEFHSVYQRISQFVSVELSSIYHDVIKDRLYTDAANSHRRRSSQTALHQILSGLCRMLSPILAFTADEAWEFIPGTKGSVHASDWESFPFALSNKEQATWKNLFELREVALPVLETERKEKRIGKALEAKVVFTGKPELLAAAKEHTEDLRELLNVSKIELIDSDDEELKITAPHAEGEKCERCWRWEPDVKSHEAHPTLCGRCVEAVEACESATES